MNKATNPEQVARALRAMRQTIRHGGNPYDLQPVQAARYRRSWQDAARRGKV